MSEIKVNKFSPRSGTTVTMGDSGDTFTIPSGVSLNVQGSVSGFTSTGIDDNATSVAITISSDEDVTFTEDILLGDNKKAIFGAGSDLQIYHDGSHSYISDQGTGDLRFLASNSFVFKKADGSANMITATADGNVGLSYGGSQKLSTTATGIDVTGTAVTDGLTVAGNVSVDGGTIKLDGRFPTGTQNTALGHEALASGSLSGGFNVAVGETASDTVRPVSLSTFTYP